MSVRMELVGIHVDSPSNTPVMLLRETEGDRRTLAIMIGGPEAQAIAFALDGVEVRRPMTHDLMTHIIEELNARVERVVVSALRDSTYYADLVMTGPDGQHIVSARPSDAIAIAVRLGTPIHADEDVLAEAGYVDVPDETEVESDEVVEEFKEFIEHVNPEDFAS